MKSQVALVAAVLVALALQATEAKAARSEYGETVSAREACGVGVFRRGCKKVTFICQEKSWHLPEIWRVVFNRGGEFTLITGSHFTEIKYHRLDRMDPWVIIPVEMTEEIDRKLIIHQDKLSGAMVIKKRLFDRQTGYQDAEYKYYCRSSFGEFEQ